MKKKILLQDLADFLDLREGLGKREADNFVRCFFEVIEDGLFQDKFVKIKGFGTFKLVAVSERDSVNINTGERFLISGHTKISFTPDTAMKELVNRPFAHFESVDLSDDTDVSEFEEIDQQMSAEEDEDDLDADDTDLTEEEDDDLNPDNADDSADEAEDETDEEEASDKSAPVDAPAAADKSLNDEAADEEDGLEEVEAGCPQPIENGNEGDEHNQPAEADNAAANGVELTSVVMIDDDNEEADSSDNHQTVQQMVADKAHTAEHNDTADADGAEEEIQVTVPRTISSHTDDDKAFHQSADMGYTYVEVPSRRKRNWWKISMLLLCQLLIMTVCYFAGYYRVLCPCSYTYLDKVMGVNHPAVSLAATADSALARKVDMDGADSVKTKQMAAETAKLAAKTADGAADTVQHAREKTEAQPKETANEATDKKTERPAFHVVKRGDNLSVISRKYYGSDRMVSAIMKHNKIKDANNIHLGMKLKLP